MDFKQAEQKFKQLKAQFKAGVLSETEFKTQLEELMIEDEHGDWWMIGYETERWHRHDGTSWVQTEPPIASVSAPRRSYFPLAIVTTIICLALSISGYYMLNNTGMGSLQVSTSTAENTLSTSVIPFTGATPTPQPTKQASKTPQATSTSQVEFQAEIAVNKANLYKGPGLGYGLAQQSPYQKGEKLTVLARDQSGLWLLSSAPDGSEGWLYIDWIKVDFDPMIISIAESIPPLLPTPTRKPRDNNPNPGCVFNC